MTKQYEMHVSPIGDLLDHELEEDGCVCGPTVEQVVRPDGTIGWLYTHHSLDGRELHERPRGPA